MNLTPSGRRIGRASAAIAAMILSTFAAAGAASAAPSTHGEEHYVSLTGVGIAIPGASASLQSTHSSEHGSNAGFELWVEPDLPWTAPPTYTSGRADLIVGAGDASLSGTFDILDRDGVVVGNGVLDASFEPIGAPEEISWPKSAGNDKHREAQVYQQMAVSGSVVASVGPEQYVVPLESASAFAADFTVFRNDPAATVEWLTYTDLGFVGTSGDIVVQLVMHEDGGNAITEVVVQTPDQIFTAQDDGSGTTFNGGRYALDLALQPAGGGGNGIVASAATGGVIRGSATVRPAERFAWTEELGGITLRFAVQTYTVAGSFTIAFDDGSTHTFTMDDGNGYAEQVSYRLFQPAE